MPKGTRKWQRTGDSSVPAKCYCKFEVGSDGYIHFSQDFPKTTAEAWAIAFAKSGGVGFGNI